jgi:Tat protein translocase TatB subunit
MFELGGSLQEILLILVVGLLVVGPKRLPEVGRMLVRAMRELRRASDEFRSTIETNLNLDAPAPRPSSTEPGVQLRIIAKQTQLTKFSFWRRRLAFELCFAR